MRERGAARIPFESDFRGVPPGVETAWSRGPFVHPDGMSPRRLSRWVPDSGRDDQRAGRDVLLQNR